MDKSYEARAVLKEQPSYVVRRLYFSSNPLAAKGIADEWFRDTSGKYASAYELRLVSQCTQDNIERCYWLRRTNAAPDVPMTYCGHGARGLDCALARRSQLLGTLAGWDVYSTADDSGLYDLRKEATTCSQ